MSDIKMTDAPPASSSSDESVSSWVTKTTMPLTNSTNRGTILAVREVSFNKSIDSTVVGDKAKPSDQPIIISDEDEYYSNEEDGEGNNRDSKTPPKRKSFWTGKRTGTMTKKEIEYQLNLSPTPPPTPKTPERTASGDEWDNFPVTPVTREIWPGHSGLTPELSPGWILPCAQIQCERQPIEDIYEGVEFPEVHSTPHYSSRIS
jgi:hypothetical protein